MIALIGILILLIVFVADSIIYNRFPNLRFKKPSLFVILFEINWYLTMIGAGLLFVGIIVSLIQMIFHI